MTEVEKTLAFEKDKILAEQGDADAQDSLCYMYYFGDGVEQDLAEAKRWATKAAEQGHELAEVHLRWVIAAIEQTELFNKRRN